MLDNFPPFRFFCAVHITSKLISSKDPNMSWFLLKNYLFSCCHIQCKRSVVTTRAPMSEVSNPTYLGGWDQRITVQGQDRQKKSLRSQLIQWLEVVTHYLSSQCSWKPELGKSTFKLEGAKSHVLSPNDPGHGSSGRVPTSKTWSNRVQTQILGLVEWDEW
jgi:hypothetical protein